MRFWNTIGKMLPQNPNQKSESEIQILTPTQPFPVSLKRKGKADRAGPGDFDPFFVTGISLETRFVGKHINRSSENFAPLQVTQSSQQRVRHFVCKLQLAPAI